jgi:hypothetical protein
MALRSLSLQDLYLGWLIFFSLIFTPFSLAMAPNDLRSIAQYLAAGAGVAAVFSAWFSVPIWLAIKATA